MIERLLEADACVYLTDCMKFYTDDVVAGGRPPQNYVRQSAPLPGSVQGRTGRRDRGLRAGCHRDPRERGGRFCRHRASREGLAPQQINGRAVVAAYHTGARPLVIRNLGFQSTQEYFNQVFATVAEVRRG